jgi:hypothetical protein
MAALLRLAGAVRHLPDEQLTLRGAGTIPLRHTRTKGLYWSVVLLSSGEGVCPAMEVVMRKANVHTMIRLTNRLLPVLLGVVVAAPALGASLKIGPSAFIISSIKPGETYDINRVASLRLSIMNDDDVPNTWLLSTEKAAERPSEWEKGYSAIPDPAWCWFEKKEITIPPKSTEYANFFIKIPPDEKYYNQHWVVGLAVSGKPVSGQLSLGGMIRAQIETQGKADIQGMPDGPLGLKPSLAAFQTVKPGVRAESAVTLCNNTDNAHTYTLSSLFDDPKIEKPIYLVSPFQAIPDPKWVEADKQIQVGAGATAILHFGLTVPDAPEYYGRKWEDLVLITPDNGIPAFVRVKVETVAKPSAP